MRLLDARCAHLSISTIADGCEPWLYLKLITRGSLTIEQSGRSRSLCAGEMVLVDSARPYYECFAEPTQLVALLFHPRSLKERGFRRDLSDFVVPNMTAPDVRAVGEMIMSIVGQQGETSVSMRRRQGGNYSICSTS